MKKCSDSAAGHDDLSLFKVHRRLKTNLRVLIHLKLIDSLTSIHLELFKPVKSESNDSSATKTANTLANSWRVFWPSASSIQMKCSQRTERGLINKNS